MYVLEALPHPGELQKKLLKFDKPQLETAMTKKRLNSV